MRHHVVEHDERGLALLPGEAVRPEDPAEGRQRGGVVDRVGIQVVVAGRVQPGNAGGHGGGDQRRIQRQVVVGHVAEGQAQGRVTVRREGALGDPRVVAGFARRARLRIAADDHLQPVRRRLPLQAEVAIRLVRTAPEPWQPVGAIGHRVSGGLDDEHRGVLAASQLPTPVAAAGNDFRAIGHAHPWQRGFAGAATAIAVHVLEHHAAIAGPGGRKRGRGEQQQCPDMVPMGHAASLLWWICPIMPFVSVCPVCQLDDGWNALDSTTDAR